MISNRLVLLRHLLLQHFLHPAHEAVLCADLNPMRVNRRFRQQSLNNPFRELSRPLVVLLNKGNEHPRLDVFSCWYFSHKNAY